MSITALTVPVLVPPDMLKAMLSPPVVTAFPAASRVVTRAVTVLPLATVEEVAETRLVASETGPGVTVIVGKGDVSALPLIVAPIVAAVPAVVPVNVPV